MRMVVLWGLLVLLQLQLLVSGHTLGRTSSSASELDQLQVRNTSSFIWLRKHLSICSLCV